RAGLPALRLVLVWGGFGLRNPGFEQRQRRRRLLMLGVKGSGERGTMLVGCRTQRGVGVLAGTSRILASACGVFRGGNRLGAFALEFAADAFQLLSRLRRAGIRPVARAHRGIPLADRLVAGPCQRVAFVGRRASPRIHLGARPFRFVLLPDGLVAPAQRFVPLVIRLVSRLNRAITKAERVVALLDRFVPLPCRFVASSERGVSRKNGRVARARRLAARGLERGGQLVALFEGAQRLRLGLRPRMRRRVPFAQRFVAPADRRLVRGPGVSAFGLA